MDEKNCTNQKIKAKIIFSRFKTYFNVGAIKRFIFKNLIFFPILFASVDSISSTSDLYAGTSKIEISERNAGIFNDPAYVKAIVLQRGKTLVVIVTLDVVALAEIGGISNDFMLRLRARAKNELGLSADNLIVTASHSHSIIRGDVIDLTMRAIKIARTKSIPVKVGLGATKEYRISENRRLLLDNGGELDVRHAYSLPSDISTVATGKIDPAIGVLRIDDLNSRPVAVLYNFAAHPILGVPSGGNTADYPGFASKVIEETLGGNVVAFFLQGAAGDVNPRRYKDINQARDAEPMGERLAIDVIKAWKNIVTKRKGQLSITKEVIQLPLDQDIDNRIEKNIARQTQLLNSIVGSSLNFRSFIELYMQKAISPEYPSAHKYRYLQEKSLGQSDLSNLDSEKKQNIGAYLTNIYIMEEITQLKTNLDLLKKHKLKVAEFNSKYISVELFGIRIDNMKLVTFPGEISVEIGIDMKSRNGDDTYIVGYTNGYIYYTPTPEQKKNIGFAQEDCESIVAPEWRAVFDQASDSIVNRLK